MQCSHLAEVNANDMTLHLLDHFVPRGLDAQRKYMRDFISGHYLWFKTISETYLKCLGIDAVVYANKLSEPGYPWDLLAIVLFSRMWRIHCCVLFEDYLFISREDEDAEKCPIRLMCIGDNKFCLVDDLRSDRSWNNLIIRTAVRNTGTAEDTAADNNEGGDSEVSASPVDNTDLDSNFDIGAVYYTSDDSSEQDGSSSDSSSGDSEGNGDEGYSSSQQSGDETEEIDNDATLEETGTNGNVLSETEQNTGQEHSETNETAVDGCTKQKTGEDTVGTNATPVDGGTKQKTGEESVGTNATPVDGGTKQKTTDSSPVFCLVPPSTGVALVPTDSSPVFCLVPPSTGVALVPTLDLSSSGQSSQVILVWCVLS